MLVELARLGSMRGVADQLGTTTSTVSQQIAMLARETGTQLVEPDGRGVRLTPAARRLVEHAGTILGALEAARRDLDPDAEPAGTVHVAGFATAIRNTLLPVAASLAGTHPDVKVVVHEHEPAEALALLAADAVDLALTYDYNLAPAAEAAALDSVALWSIAWGLGVPTAAAKDVHGDAAAVLNRFRDHDWIGNSRNPADEVVVRLIASMAGFTPRFAHHADSLELVEDLILGGMGVGLLAADRPPRPGVTVLPLAEPDVVLRAFAHTRRGRAAWPPLRLVLDRLPAAAAA